MREAGVEKIKTIDSNLRVDQQILFVRQWIPEDDEGKSPIILMHDSLGCVALWRDFPERLAVRLNRKVIAYDRFGFGQSSARFDVLPLHFVEEEAKSIIPVLTDALELSEFLIMGHSVGGAMALSVAAFNANCNAVISVSSQTFVEERTRNGIRKAQEAFGNQETFNKLKQWHQEKSQWVLNSWTGTWLSPDFKSWNIKSELAGISCPVLVIHGDQDEYGSLAFPKMIANSTQGVTQLDIYKQCGHVPHREQPERVVKSVLRFVGKNLTG